jgi:hypothetical protein
VVTIGTMIGAFAAASFTSLLGAAFVITQHDVARQVAMTAALGCGVVGFGGLVVGSAVLVWESRLTLAILAEETDLVEGLHRGLPQEADADSEK